MTKKMISTPQIFVETVFKPTITVADFHWESKSSIILSFGFSVGVWLVLGYEAESRRDRTYEHLTGKKNAKKKIIRFLSFCTDNSSDISRSLSKICSKKILTFLWFEENSKTIGINSKNSPESYMSVYITLCSHPC